MSSVTTKRPSLFAPLAFLLLAALPRPAAAQAEIKVGEDVRLRFGLLLQPQADWSQDSAGGTAQNFSLRRVRLLVGGQVLKNVFFNFATENASLGKTGANGKSLATGFQILDASVEWRPFKVFGLIAGLGHVPTCREGMKGSTSLLAPEASAYALLANGPTQGTGGRDVGLQARGYLFDERLEYRVGAFQGMRVAGSRNPFLGAARLQWEFFDREPYAFTAYSGSYLGSKKILAVGGAVDFQMDYTGLSADLYTSLPTGGGAIEGTLQYQNVDGGKTFATQLARSDAYFVEGGYYVNALKMVPYLRWERRLFNRPDSRDETRLSGGLTWYASKNNVKLQAFYSRVFPRDTRGTNQFTLQLQIYYF